ncbi:zf-TFIIB domain-containing protein [Undibacterium fentianense]|uniref:Zf-TFIIB domain-containing protein n=1 Tax=Undibacterium fentianense TaxID=2828728 RepID=A0A941E0Y9_9BURK|nr:zf-TFIIB domain-containing protein [Undibacterium fentianense]MBR7799252.1 zf-TFIIB domain-containing protein [Undibacterium fentianense]
MKCPVCTTCHLLMSERQGVEIDYCPQCRGVWLDRGELDKIIQLSGTQTHIPQSDTASLPPMGSQIHQTSSPHPGHTEHKHIPAPAYHPPAQKQYSNHHQTHYPQQNTQYKKRKESFLSELFDFD